MKLAERRQVPISVGSFIGAGADQLQLDVAAGAGGLKRRIREAAINRPGLALSGFYRHFAHRRIQVIGWAEYDYLSSLSGEERRERLHAFFEKDIPCVVVARGKRLLKEMEALAEERHVPILRTKMITKHFINAATILVENLMAPRSKVQGTMVEIMGIGVLICGKAGMGKSEAALELIRRGHALVSDDITSLRVDSAGAVIGSPVSVTRYHMEIRGLGIIHVPSLFGVASVRGEKKLDLVATLTALRDRVEDDRSGETKGTIEILGEKIPHVYIPVAPGRDITNVLEAAALDQKLKALGHDATKELDERLIALLSRGRDVSE